MTHNKEITLNQLQNMDNAAKVTIILTRESFDPHESRIPFRGKIWLNSKRLKPKGQYYFDTYTIISSTFSKIS